MKMGDNSTTTNHRVPTLPRRRDRNKFDCSETSGYTMPQDAINEVYFFGCQISLYSVDRIMHFNRAEPTCYRTNFPYARSAAFSYTVHVLRLTYIGGLILKMN